MNLRNFILLALITFLTACSVKLLTPKQSDVDRVSDKFPGYSLMELKEGKEMFKDNCSKCHRLKDPQSKTEAEWREIVPKMVARAQKKSITITEKEQDAILKYLITMSTAERKK